jgi:hypothetical protein
MEILAQRVLGMKAHNGYAWGHGCSISWRQTFGKWLTAAPAILEESKATSTEVSSGGMKQKKYKYGRLGKVGKSRRAAWRRRKAKCMGL